MNKLKTNSQTIFLKEHQLKILKPNIILVKERLLTYLTMTLKLIRVKLFQIAPTMTLSNIHPKMKKILRKFLKFYR
jgi:hypothetical protein